MESEEVNALYFSPNIIWMIEPRRMWYLGERRGAYRVLVEKT